MNAGKIRILTGPAARFGRRAAERRRQRVELDRIYQEIDELLGRIEERDKHSLQVRAANDEVSARIKKKLEIP